MQRSVQKPFVPLLVTQQCECCWSLQQLRSLKLSQPITKTIETNARNHKRVNTETRTDVVKRKSKISRIS